MAVTSPLCTARPNQTSVAGRFWVWGLPFGLAAAALVVYLASRSASLDDFDSYSFALALDRCDLALQQPQPPGFPVYVALGRLFKLLAGDARLALTTLSAVGGALSVGLVTWLAQAILPRRDAALAAGAIFALAPMQWLNSAKALSDVPGLAFSLAALAALWLARTDHRWLIAGAVLLGLSLGVRLQSNLPGLLLWAWMLWETLRARRWRALVLALTVFGLAVALWLIPTAQAAGGLGAYRDLIDAHRDHVWRSDSLFGAGPVNAVTLRARLKDCLDTFLVPTLGISVYAPLELPDRLQLIALTGWIGIGVLCAAYRRVENRLLALWFVLAFVPYFLFESLNRPRLMLPALPPLILLAVGGWARLAGRGAHMRWVAWIVWSAAAAALWIEGAPLASILASDAAPPAQAAAYIRATYPPAETLVAAAGSFRAAQVELPGYRLIYLYGFDAQAASDAIHSGAYRYVAILDRDVAGEMIAVLDGDGLYVPVEDRSFTRDPRVHWQHSQVRLQTLMPLDQLDAARLRLPPDGRIDLGGPDDGRFLGRGWFRGEMVGTTSARWAGDDLIGTLRVALGPRTAYRVTVRAAAYPAGQTVIVRVNGQDVARFELAQDWGEYTFTLDPGLWANGEITTIELIHARAEAPYERTGGSSSDRRRLTAAYDWFAFAPPP